MKKIVTGFVALAMAASIFAVDFSARVYMKGDIVSNDGTDTKIWDLQNSDQKDADALIVSTNGEKAGAQFQLWYNYNGGAAVEAADTVDASGNVLATTVSGSFLQVRSSSIWFKPVDMLKVTVGDISLATYKEQVHWWKDVTGSSYSYFEAWRSKYSAYAAVEGSGLAVELTPADNLYFAAGLARPAKLDAKKEAFSGFAAVPFFNTADSSVRGAYGFIAKYSNIAGLPLSAAISWRDDGTYKNNVNWDPANDTESIQKILAIGFDYGNAWADGIYAMINARLNFAGEDSWGWKPANQEEVKLRGIGIDNYFKFTAGALVAHFRAPVVVRLGDKKADPSYMSFSGEVSYALSGFTPYLFLSDNDGGYNFADFENTFQMQIKPGVKVNVGAAAINVAASINVPKKGNDLTWSVPFEISCAF